MKFMSRRPSMFCNITQPGKRGVLVLRLTAEITKDGEWYVARCLEVEVTSQGRTVEEALSNLHEVLELYFDDVPNIEPFSTPIIAPVEIEVNPT
jgi:predicted RNase H-like HicB family nuclease